MFVAFDTETTGLPRSWQAPPSDVDNWPRVVQLAWEFFDLCGRKVLTRCDLIRPDGFTIPKDAEIVHGISTSVAIRKGLPIANALDEFMKPLAVACVLVAHNVKFDANVVGAEFYRLKLRDPLPDKASICTMEASTEHCALPGRYGFKWPTLPELHFRLFNSAVTEAHDAAADVAACSKCFVELRRLRVVAVPSLDAAACSECRVALECLGIVCTSRDRRLTTR